MKTIFSLGVMTGTSCDGADLALVRYDSSFHETLVATKYVAFSEALRGKLRKAQSTSMSFQDAARLEKEYSEWIGRQCKDFLDGTLGSIRVANRSVLVSVHGQTVWHAPLEGLSIQWLDPAIVAMRTGATVVSRFRQPDLARGGQGAPLVPYYHWLRARSRKGPWSKQTPFAIHNIGGISNLTLVTHRAEDVVGFDTGPGNCLIDLAVEKWSRGKLKYDRDGTIARKSLDSINLGAIKRLMTGSFFEIPPPKSTGREIFNETYLTKFMGTGRVLVAETTAFTALTMAQSYALMAKWGWPTPKVIYVAGGGAKNSTLISLFRELVGIPTLSLPEAFAPVHFLEAMAFARFGIETIFGRSVTLPHVTGAISASTAGCITPGENYIYLVNRVREITKN